jgi:ABC-type multidrug transport system ATPase subunit
MLRLNGIQRRLPESAAHVVWMHDDRLRVSTAPPADGSEFGRFVYESGRWRLRTSEHRRPAALRLNGEPVRSTSVDVAGDVELSLGAPVARWTTTTGRTGPAPGGKARRPRSLVIGRAGTGADVEIPDPMVRAEHALLEIDTNGRWWVTESAGRVLVDGRRVRNAVLDVGKVFVVGQTAVTAGPELLAPGLLAPGLLAPDLLAPGPLTPGLRAGGRPSDLARAGLRISAGKGLPIVVDGVTVERSGKTLLDDVTVRVGAGQVCAVVGPSGAGKSSFIKMLLGEYQPDRGRVEIGGPGRSGGQQVRYVPQSDDLYPNLTVAETLTFAGRFRAAPDAPADYVQGRVDEALSWLGLGERASGRIHQLSGGERRRVSIGVELVGLPQLLLLDEPTSGLDMGKDRDIMRRLHTISREFHCTVVIVTHSVAHLDEYVDHLVVMARGGHVRYAGPPVAPSTQGFRDWADWLADLDKDAFAGLGKDAFAGAGRAPAGARRPARIEPPRPVGPAPRPAATPSGLPTAVRRQALLVLRRGGGSLASLGGLPLIGTMVAVWASHNGLSPGPDTTQVLSILITVAALVGASLTYLDLVHDRAILQRDWRVGVSAAKLVLAKALVHGVVGLLLAAFITAAFLVSRDGPPAPLLFAAIGSVIIASMSLGLLVSALARTLERAVTYNTLLAVLQVALNGALFKVPLWGTAILPSRLGLATVAAHADLNRYRTGALYQDPLWDHATVVVPVTLLGMAVISIVAVVLASRCAERSWRG